MATFPISSTARTHVKLLDQVNVPFTASLSLSDDYAEVDLCVFVGSGSAAVAPQAAIHVSLRYVCPHPWTTNSPSILEELASVYDNPKGSLHGIRLQERLGTIPISFFAVTKEKFSSSDAHLQVADPALAAEAVATAAVHNDDAFLSLVAAGRADEDDKLAAMALLEAANEGVAYREPKLVNEGEGGTYFVYDEMGDVVGVFKPTDEDPQGANNPKRKLTNDASRLTDPEASLEKQPRTRQTIPANETAVREAAAYAIDRGYAGVPPTFLVRARHASFDNGKEAKLGSLQQFAVSECAAWDVGPACFSVQDVHRVGIFDIRTFNTDRHGGNLLCRKTEKPHGKVRYDLIPIDHAYCFPTALSEANWEWLYWPQAKVPFSQEELRYIESIDVAADVALLTSMGLGEEALRVYRVTSTLLKKGAAAGLSLFEIGQLCYRGRNNSASQLEEVCAAFLDFEQCRHPGDIPLTSTANDHGDAKNPSPYCLEHLERALEVLCQTCLHPSNPVIDDVNRAPSTTSRC